MPLAEIASQHQHTECIYLSNTNIQQMIRWMCGVSMKDRKTGEDLRELVGIEPIKTVIERGRLRWYGHVMRKSNDGRVKKCMDYGVEGRRPVGRPTRTCL